jgi:isochorismate synthase
METLSSINQSTLHQYLSNLLLENFEEGNQVAIWRGPRSAQVQILIDQTGVLKKVPLNLEELPAGFIVHPFEDQPDKKAFFLEANHLLTIALDVPFEEQIENLKPVQVQHSVEKCNDNIRVLFVKAERDKQYNEKAEDKQTYLDLVENGRAEIAAGKLMKIVPARTKVMRLDSSFDLVAALQRLIHAYPNAFINFFHIPGVGSWIGASPELLIHTKENIFQTMSLAGTQKAQGDNPLKSVAWTQKEIEEQALVGRYIVDCFKKIRLREYEEHGPKTVIAGNLLHLRSDFKVDMDATNFPQLGSVMLELLHPTSAVCGMPRQEALAFLATHEAFDRSLFAGFIGPVNINSETSIYVNLRTARLMEKQAILFAGAGVTEDSIPEKEWEETEMKCDIIGRHLNLTSPL